MNGFYRLGTMLSVLKFVAENGRCLFCAQAISDMNLFRNCSGDLMLYNAMSISCYSAKGLTQVGLH